jgi:hypothetical protein
MFDLLLLLLLLLLLFPPLTLIACFELCGFIVVGEGT